MATNVESQPTGHFMRLPLEIREMIYRPLVIARHVMREHTMKSKEFDQNRRNIQDGPDQKYRFEPTILATNRRVYDEVRDLCRRENDFICLTSQQPSRLGHELQELGLQMIVTYSRARIFWNISMTLTMDPPTLTGWPEDSPRWPTRHQWEDAPEDGRPWNYIFYRDELPEFCRLVLKLHRETDSLLKETVLYIGLNSAITDVGVKAIDNHPAGRARMEKLLGPLRRLHGFGAAQIDGPLSGSYKGEIIENVCKHCPVAMDIVHETVASLEQADEKASKGQLQQANFVYKAALSLMRSCCWQHQEQDFIMSDGPFPGLEVSRVVSNIVVLLQARIAAVYFKSNQLRMARIYTERALDPRRSYDHRINKIFYPLRTQPWELVVYAEVLHVAAMISYTHGDVRGALLSLSEASKYAPFNEEQQSRYEAWQGHVDKLEEKYLGRAEAREKRLENQAEAMIGVVCNWKRKGEHLFRTDRSYLAASVYQTALKKLKKLKILDRDNDLMFNVTTESVQGHKVIDAIKVLKFRVKACLVAASLKSREYKDVVAQADAALKCNYETHVGIHSHHTCCNHSYNYSRGEWAEDQKAEYLRLHYCKAIALYHLGDTVAAVEHMEEAHRLDPGDNYAFEKLTMFKQKKLAEETVRQEEEAVRRKLRLAKLNKPQTQLREKQERRRTKA